VIREVIVHPYDKLELTRLLIKPLPSCDRRIQPCTPSGVFSLLTLGAFSYVSGMKYEFRSKLFEPHPDKDEIAFSWLAYDIGRYFFEMVRNILVIGTLKFFMDKTGHWALILLFLLSLGAYLFMIQSFFISWRFRIFAHFVQGNAGKNLDFLLSFVFGAVFIFGSWLGVVNVAAQIAAITR
jgi:hypothetical protein